MRVRLVQRTGVQFGDALGRCNFSSYGTAESFWIPCVYVACCEFFVSLTRKILVSPSTESIVVDRQITISWTYWKV